MKNVNMKNDEEKYISCAIMGDGMVGKTSISESYAQKSFKENYEATVFDNYVVPLNVAGEEFVISMFDTAGKKNFENLRSFTYRESEVLLLCFSTCDRETLASINDVWMPELKRHSKHTKQKRPVILVGTQIDLRFGNEDSEVSTDEGVQLAKDIGADCYVECSARDHKGLKEVFQHVVFSALKFRKKNTNIIKKIFRR
ncbi:rho-related GTP-binding protein RhoJ-like [Haliotis rufescens]|uniref:rho-related GTP-binding protein RhoJ-like n=1 Tax=Haliotis rufescens TaxID=6454 RepID=UPI001EB07E7F|nr:rho-related GTP-binding protein RhoJ-like [Haliotis rufescens]